METSVLNTGGKLLLKYCAVILSEKREGTERRRRVPVGDGWVGLDGKLQKRVVQTSTISSEYQTSRLEDPTNYVPPPTGHFTRNTYHLCPEEFMSFPTVCIVSSTGQLQQTSRVLDCP